MSDQIDARLRRLQQQVSAIRRLHADDLELILDQLRELAAGIDQAPPPPAGTPDDAATASPTDPAAASPKRAAWLAEQERRSQRTRRDLLRRPDREQEKRQ